MARTRRRGRRWIARFVALAALLAFWGGLLVLAGLPRWTLAVPGAVAAIVVASAVVPVAARLTAVAGRHLFAVLVRSLALAYEALAWSGGHGAAVARASGPLAATALRAAGRAGAQATRRAVVSGRRASRAVRRAATTSASTDLARRRRRGAELALASSRLVGEGRPDEAVAVGEHALALVRPAGDARVEASALETLALAHVGRGDEERALECYERLLAVLGRLGDASGASRVLTEVAALRRWREAADEPVARWRRGVERLERPKRRKRKTPARKPSSR